MLEIKNIQTFYGKIQALRDVSIKVDTGEIVSLIGANSAGIFLHLMPVLSAIIAMIIFNEKFMFYHMLGAIFILTGILLSNRKIKNA